MTKRIIISILSLFLVLGDVAHADIVSGDAGSNVTLATGQVIGPTDAGTVFTVTKDVTSSAILASGATTLWTASGSMLVLKITSQTDSTGLAGCTNFTLTTNDTFGKTTLASQAITALGASTTVDMINAATTAFYPFVLSTGKLISDRATGVDCTGTGVIRLSVTAKRLTNAAALN